MRGSSGSVPRQPSAPNRISAGKIFETMAMRPVQNPDWANVIMAVITTSAERKLDRNAENSSF